MGLNPQQALFKELYVDPGSETFGNVYQSAMKAGYSHDYARSMTSVGQGNAWFSEILGDIELEKDALNALKDTVKLDDFEEGKRNAALTRVRLEASKFALSGLNKKKWSPLVNQDLTTNGKDLPTPLLANVQCNDSD